MLFTAKVDLSEHSRFRQCYKDRESDSDGTMHCTEKWPSHREWGGELSRV